MSSYPCPNCQEDEVPIGDVIKCPKCGYTASPEEAAMKYITDVLGMSEDDDDLPLWPCPECPNHSLVETDEDTEAVCFGCGHHVIAKDDEESFSHCAQCGIPFVSFGDPLCRYDRRAIADKD